MQKTKKTTAKKQPAPCPINCCSTSHKVWGAIALAGLFVCGLMLGLTYRGEPVARDVLSIEQCDAIANEIVSITQRGANAEDAKILNELNTAYTSGCAGRLVIIERDVPAPVASVDTPASRPEIMSTCMRIEKLLVQRLYSEDSPENADMYKALALRELEIASALQPEEDMGEGDAEIVIDTFKKLDMQQEAREFLDKIERLVDPATDFILQMEQIINE